MMILNTSAVNLFAIPAEGSCIDYQPIASCKATVVLRVDKMFFASV